MRNFPTKIASSDFLDKKVTVGIEIFGHRSNTCSPPILKNTVLNDSEYISAKCQGGYWKNL